MRFRLALLFSLICSAAFGQVTPGTSPLTGPKGGTNNAFMQFTGPASSLKTYTLPNASDTLAALGQIQTWTGAQSYSDGKLILLGSSSGSSTLKAPATGGGTATLFPGSDTVMGVAAAQTPTNKTFNCANNTCTVRLANDVTGQLPIANGGTGQSTKQPAFNALAPTPTRAGDVVYWNGTNYVTLAGNNSGTQVLQENASGVPVWATVSGTGTVISVATAGLASGGPITSTGTITVTAAIKSDQQTGSSNAVAVTPAVQQQHDSAAKAWEMFTVSGSTVTLVASYNMGVARTGTGSFTGTFPTPFASTGYGCVITPLSAPNDILGQMNSGNTASVVNFNFLVAASSVGADPGGAMIVCYGRQ